MYICKERAAQVLLSRIRVQGVRDVYTDIANGLLGFDHSGEKFSLQQINRPTSVERSGQLHYSYSDSIYWPRATTNMTS